MRASLKVTVRAAYPSGDALALWVGTDSAASQVLLSRAYDAALSCDFPLHGDYRPYLPR